MTKSICWAAPHMLRVYSRRTDTLLSYNSQSFRHVYPHISKATIWVFHFWIPCCFWLCFMRWCMCSWVSPRYPSTFR